MILLLVNVGRLPNAATVSDFCIDFGTVLPPRSRSSFSVPRRSGATWSLYVIVLSPLLLRGPTVGTRHVSHMTILSARFSSASTLQDVFQWTVYGVIARYTSEHTYVSVVNKMENRETGRITFRGVISVRRAGGNGVGEAFWPNNHILNRSPINQTAFCSQ